MCSSFGQDLTGLWFSSSAKLRLRHERSAFQSGGVPVGRHLGGRLDIFSWFQYMLKMFDKPFLASKFHIIGRMLNVNTGLIWGTESKVVTVQCRNNIQSWKLRYEKNNFWKCAIFYVDPVFSVNLVQALREIMHFCFCNLFIVYCW